MGEATDFSINGTMGVRCWGRSSDGRVVVALKESIKSIGGATLRSGGISPIFDLSYFVLLPSVVLSPYKCRKFFLLHSTKNCHVV
jgi:hypothetical protein